VLTKTVSKSRDDKKSSYRGGTSPKTPKKKATATVGKCKECFSENDLCYGDDFDYEDDEDEDNDTNNSTANVTRGKNRRGNKDARSQRVRREQKRNGVGVTDPKRSASRDKTTSETKTEAGTGDATIINDRTDAASNVQANDSATNDVTTDTKPLGHTGDNNDDQQRNRPPSPFGEVCDHDDRNSAE